jgi:predicted DNA-binding ribbon-helix-helix protein
MRTTLADLRQNPASHSELNSYHERSHSAELARLSVAVPKSLYKRLKLVAHDRDMTVSALVLQLIRSEID